MLDPLSVTALRNATSDISSTSSPSSQPRRLGWAMGFAALVVFGGMAFGGAASAQTAHFSWAESTVGSGFSSPQGVAVDGSGNLYIADYSNNRIVKETLAGSSYTQSVAITGLTAPYGVAVDSSGNLYIAANGGSGPVLKETLSGGSYTQSTIGSTSFPGGVAVDGSGTVYISDHNSSQILKETPSGGSYSETSIPVTGMQFAGGLTVDTSGNIYVADYWHSRVLKLALSGGSYTQTTVDSALNFPDGVAVDASGNLYVADNDNNRVVKETLSGGSYIQSLVLGGVRNAQFIAIDSNGSLYFPDTSNNLMLKLQPGSANLGSVAVGSTSASQTLIFTFDTAGTLGSKAVLSQGIAGLDFADAGTGSCAAGTAYAAGATCTIDVKFSPAAPGQRLGAAVLKNSTGAAIATAFAYGTGTGPQAAFTPGMIGALATGFNSPYGSAVDAAGNVYVADRLNNLVRKVTAVGVVTTVAGGGSSPATCTGHTDAIGDGCAATNASLSSPQGVAVDGSGNLFIADHDNNRVREVSAGTGIIATVAGGGSAPTTCAGNIGSNAIGDGCAATSAALSGDSGVAVDGSGNLYIADQLNSRIRKVSAATGIITTAAGNGVQGYRLADEGVAATGAELYFPYGIAVGADGNLYIGDTYNARVRKVDASGIITTVAGGGSGSCPGQTNALGDGCAAIGALLSTPSGVAADAAGNVYIADYGSQRIREVAAGSGIIATVAGNGTAGYTGDGGAATAAELNFPAAVTLDAAGNLYIADSTNNVLRKVTVGAGSLSFASTAVGSTSSDSPQTVALANIGNVSLAFPPPATGGNPSISAGFAIGNTSTCPQLTSGSSAGSLASGASCTDLISFAPSTAGSFSGSMATTDNNLNVAGSTQTVALSGTATQAATATSLSANPTSSIYGQAVVLSATVSPSAAQGTVTFYNGGNSPANILGTGTLSAGVATLSTSFLPVGTDSLTAIYGGDTNYLASASSALLYSVAGDPPTISFAVPNHAYSDAPFAVAATSNSAGAFTYSVVSGLATVAGSTVTLTGSGTVVLQASQAASGNYAAGTQTASFTVSPPPTAYTAPATGVGATSSPQTVLLTFNSATTLNSTLATAIQVLTQGAPNLDFRYLPGGTCSAGANYVSGQYCTVNVIFGPTAPGQRLGAVLLYDNAGTPAAVATSYIGGVGNSGLGLFTVGTSRSLPISLNVPRGVSVDAAGNVYLSEYGAGTLDRFAAGTGSQTTLASGIHHPTGTAVDGAGNVYFGSNIDNEVYELVGGAGTPVGIASVPNPDNSMVVDSAGNLYLPANGDGTILEIAAGTRAVSTILPGSPTSRILGMTIDAAANLYVADFGNSSIYEIPAGTSGHNLLVSGNGLNYPYGLAIDPAGNLYATNPNGDGNVIKFAAGTYAATEIPTGNARFGIAIDGSGNLLTLTDSTLTQYGRTAAPALDFGLIAIGASSAQQLVGFENDGNAALAISAIGATANFAAAGAGTPACAVGSLAVAGTCGVGVTFLPLAPGPLTGAANITDDTMNVAGTVQSIALSGIGAVPAPYIAPTYIDFGNEPSGSTSNFWTVTLNNTSRYPMILNSITLSDPVNFKQTNNCPATLPPYTNCNIQVSFSPSGVGPFTGALVFADDAINTPQSVNLTGVGTSNAPTATISPATIDFGDQTVGTSSNQWTVTLSNTSGYPITIASASLSDATDFSQTNNCGTTLAAYSTCTFQVVFTPSTAGTITGTLTITDNAIGSPQVVSLTGAGVANMPVVVLAPTSIDFGSQPVGVTSNTWTATVNNTSSLPATFSSPIAASAPFTETNNCGATLAAHSTCNVLVAFAPAMAGTATGSLTVAISGGYVVPPVPLTGIGTSSAPVLFFAPTTVDFGGQVVNTSSNSWTITLNNPSGTAATFPGPISVSGAFTQTNNCGLSLAAYSTCTVQVAFAPTATGAATGQLLALVNGSTSATVSLTGIGVAATPVVVFAPGSVDFGSQAVGTASNPWTVTLNNISDFAAPFSSPMGIVGSGDFTQTNNCGASLAAHSTCNVLVTFAPSSTGALNAQLVALIGGSSAPLTANLTGAGASATQAVFFSPSSIDFGGQTVGTTSNPWTLTLNNTSGTAATITSPIRIVGAGFSQTNNCGASLAAYSTCNVLVTFTPASTGSISAQLVATVNGGNAPSPVSLTGTGVAAAQVVIFSPTNIDFGSQAVGTASNPWTVTLSNTSSAAAIFSSPLTLSGDRAFSQTNNCGASLAAYSTCDVQVAFTPSAAGPYGGQLVAMINGSSTPLTVGLTGVGARVAPVLLFAPTNIDFGSQTVGTISNAWTVTLNNESGSPVAFGSPVVALGDPAFSQTNNCGSSLAAHSTCTVLATFAPTAPGTTTGQLSVVTSGANGAQYLVNLAGTGTAPPAPVLFFSPSRIDFGNQLVGTSNTWTATLNNTSGAAVSFASPVMVLGDPSYTETNNCGNGLAAHSTCTVRATFAPTATGTVAAQLSVVTGGAGGVQYLVPMTGTGTVPPNYTLSVNPSSLTLNAGQTGLATFIFTPVGGFAGTVNFTCTGLPAGAACVFAPPSVTAEGSNTVQTAQLTVTTTGPFSGTVTIGKNSARIGPTLAALFFFPGMAFGGLLAWRRKALPARMRRLLLALLMASVVGAATGCAVLPKLTPMGTNLVTVVSTASGSTPSGTSVSHSASFTLTIKQ